MTERGGGTIWIVLRGRFSPRGGGAMCIVFSGRTRSVLRERGSGLNLIVFNGLSLFITIILSCILSSQRRTPPLSSTGRLMHDF